MGEKTVCGMSRTEAVEAWRLWDLLPQPKRLHCEYNTFHVLIETTSDIGMGAPGEMFGASVWEEGDTPLEAIQKAVMKHAALP